MIRNPALRCVVCGKNSMLGRTHTECASRDWVLDGLLVAGDYHQGFLRDMIWHLKYTGVKDISLDLSTILIDYLVSLELIEYFAACVVIPVPLHQKKLKFRGYNQADLLALPLAERLGYRYLPILQKIEMTRNQADLDRLRRIENLRGAFTAQITPSIGERIVLLVDDVVTTGATLNECAKVLKQQQAREVWGLVVARN